MSLHFTIVVEFSRGLCFPNVIMFCLIALCFVSLRLPNVVEFSRMLRFPNVALLCEIMFCEMLCILCKSEISSRLPKCLVCPKMCFVCIYVVFWQMFLCFDPLGNCSLPVYLKTFLWIFV